MIGFCNNRFCCLSEFWWIKKSIQIFGFQIGISNKKYKKIFWPFWMGAKLNWGLSPWVVAETLKIDKPHWNLTLPPGENRRVKKRWKCDILKEHLLEALRTMVAPIDPKIQFREKRAFSYKLLSSILSSRYQAKKWHNNHKKKGKIVYEDFYQFHLLDWDYKNLF